MSVNHFSTGSETRMHKGYQIFQSKGVKEGFKSWKVASQSKRINYVVSRSINRCGCADFMMRANKCKHMYAVEYYLKELEAPKEVIKLKRPTYPQQWKQYNAAQTTEKAAFQYLLAELCKGIVEPRQEMGRPRFSTADGVFCGAYKVYSMLSARRFTTDLTEAKAKGYIDKQPHYNTVLAFLSNSWLTPLLKELITLSALPLKAIESDFAVDSTGFSSSKFDRWHDDKYGKQVSKHVWVKVHCMVGVHTNVVTSVEITDKLTGDAKMFEPLLETTAKNFTIKEVSADKAYSSRKIVNAVNNHGAMPFIPFKRNATGETGNDAVWAEMFHYYSYKRAEFEKHYHKRSNIETTFAMIKGKFGDSVKAKNAVAQINEVLLKILCHNICVLNHSMHELGINPAFVEMAA